MLLIRMKSGVVANGKTPGSGGEKNDNSFCSGISVFKRLSLSEIEENWVNDRQNVWQKPLMARIRLFSTLRENVRGGGGIPHGQSENCFHAGYFI
jgi:hypothetical protein